MYQKGKSKKILKHHVVSFVNSVLESVNNKNKLGYINIDINNHNGNIQINYILRNRKKHINHAV